MRKYFHNPTIPQIQAVGLIPEHSSVFIVSLLLKILVMEKRIHKATKAPGCPLGSVKKRISILELISTQAIYCFTRFCLVFENIFKSGFHFVIALIFKILTKLNFHCVLVHTKCFVHKVEKINILVQYCLWKLFFSFLEKGPRFFCKFFNPVTERFTSFFFRRVFSKRL